MKNTFAQIIRFHRKQSKLTQVELARLAGVGKTVVFDIENGKESIRLNTLLKVCHVLNIQIKLEGPLMHLLERELNEKS